MTLERLMELDSFGRHVTEVLEPSFFEMGALVHLIFGYHQAI
jgi:hypothetical protein